MGFHCKGARHLRYEGADVTVKIGALERTRDFGADHACLEVVSSLQALRAAYSTERKTIPVRGFGQKNVVLAGIRVRLSAT